MSHDFLRNAGAQSCAIVLDYFLKWIMNHYDTVNGNVVLVSHGNFRYDQPVLQTEMLHNHIPPPNLLFLDSLHRFCSIKKGQPSFSLSSLSYQNQQIDSLKTSYLSQESTYRFVSVDFGMREVRYALIV